MTIQAFVAPLRSHQALGTLRRAFLVSMGLAWLATITSHQAYGGEIYQAFFLNETNNGALSTTSLDIKDFAKGVPGDSYLIEIAAGRDYVICAASIRSRASWKVFGYAKDRPGYRGEIIAECAAAGEPGGGGNRIKASIAVAHIRLKGTGRAWIVIDAKSIGPEPNLVIR